VVVITASEVERVARETGFRASVVEKVLRLHGILERLNRHETTRAAWVLKGGTALNLLHLDVPRLSIDIDVNYIDDGDVEEMRRARPRFEQALSSCCAREGCDVRRAPSEHAGGKFRLRFASVLGGAQNLEVDVSYVARVPLWGVVRAPVRFPPGSDLEVPTLNVEELAAGKFAALVQRDAARDAFDAANLLTVIPDLVRRPAFRVAFVCFMAGSRTDPRHLVRPAALPGERAVEQEIDLLLRRDSHGRCPAPDALRDWIARTVEPALEPLLAWSERESRFLDLVMDAGEVTAEALVDDPAVQDRIRRQPMLNWKAKHVRERRGAR
jgi:hypothetical protein